MRRNPSRFLDQLMRAGRTFSPGTDAEGLAAARRIRERSCFLSSPSRQHQFHRQAEDRRRRCVPASSCSFSSLSRGHDITYESLTFSGGANKLPKVILQGYGPTGFDVSNILKKIDNAAEDSNETAGLYQESGTIHMNGSILAFPDGCFLWNVESARDVTLESLSAVLLYRDPTPLEYLFIGCDSGAGDSDNDIPMTELDRIKRAMQAKNIVVEKLNLANAMGTFNILNAEDRQVAVALVINKSERNDEE